MKWVWQRRTRLASAILVTLAVAIVLVVRLGGISFDRNQKVLIWSANQPQSNSARADNSEHGLSVSSPATPQASPPATPNILPAPSPAATVGPASPATSDAPANLIVPVLGVRRDQLRDTFSEARSEGRVHDAIDIPAPHGTQVVAVADGKIVKLFHSDRGGTTIYQLSTDSRFIFYYAHLDRYAGNLQEGQSIRQGETIGYVGDTGNAGPGNYHLHFSIAIATDPKKYWQGTNIDPYPLLAR